MSATRIVPVCVLGALALVALMSGAMGKNNQTFDGLVVQDNLRYEFYPGLTDCRRQGTPYWIVPNRNFYEMMRITTDTEHLERLFHGAWRVKLRGDLSRIGRYGYQGSYWREITVTYVIDAAPLDCKDIFSDQPRNF